MADTNTKLDLILEKLAELEARLTAIEDNQEGLEEGQADLKESVANLSLPGSGYSVFTPEE
jgi:hypothetical protein